MQLATSQELTTEVICRVVSAIAAVMVEVKYVTVSHFTSEADAGPESNGANVETFSSSAKDTQLRGKLTRSQSLWIRANSCVNYRDDNNNRRTFPPPAVVIVRKL